jgi:hypothetical protein
MASICICAVNRMHEAARVIQDSLRGLRKAKAKLTCVAKKGSTSSGTNLHFPRRCCDRRSIQISMKLCVGTSQSHAKSNFAVLDVRQVAGQNNQSNPNDTIQARFRTNLSPVWQIYHGSIEGAVGGARRSAQDYCNQCPTQIRARDGHH